jgi:D-3-phosphoglycerate dehydrogenase / 2-oxoglutarate reductase
MLLTVQVGIERADLEDIWAKSDFITVHTPLTKETNNLIDDATIAKCKEGVRIVNCARGVNSTHTHTHTLHLITA